MRADAYTLHLALLFIWAILICSGQAHGQPDKILQLEVGTEKPNCLADRFSLLCQIEKLLTVHFRERDVNPTNFSGYTVIKPVTIDYYVEKIKVLEAADIERLPTRWHEDIPPHGLKPGAVKVELRVAFEDAYGIRWPRKGWLRHEYLLREPNDTQGLISLAETSSREIRWDRASSDCIGMPSTPLCAVETLLACHIRQIKALCGTVDSSVGGELRWATSVTYIVHSIAAVDDGSLPAGEKYAVMIEESDIYRRPRYGNQEYVRYLVTQSQDVWQVVARTVVQSREPQGRE